jgi:hypothetical protein
MTTSLLSLSEEYKIAFLPIDEEVVLVWGILFIVLGTKAIDDPITKAARTVVRTNMVGERFRVVYFVKYYL